ncbi:hypothetical protein C453_18265 [Haloferax elongans ATCC BAA-1513]|uniref:Uncharacterized protein n=1 Tax=Haloferax elongans ATCC BAA-1513 TaxID=1230453 RepID=M0HAU0_HALEO|nr:hypothetical protein [Haloferax elongans]ELZ80908.1 hypothetical protein C453_18265 [Haloferax elongans ATCC BAA-1513]
MRRVTTAFALLLVFVPGVLFFLSLPNVGGFSGPLVLFVGIPVVFCCFLGYQIVRYYAGQG